jgi:hypothetical protein
MMPRDVGHREAGREADDERPSASPKRRGYVLAALVGCTVGQLLLLGFLLASRNAALSRDADVTVPSQTVTSAAVTSPPPPVAAPSPVRNSTTTSTAPVDSAQPSPMPPPEPVHVPLRGVPAETTPAEARRMSAPSATRPSAVRSHNRAESQAQVRAALREWLATSGIGRDSLASEAVVILGADGRTARTQVPIRWGGAFVVREQRWQRDASVWRIVDDRDARRAR